MALSDHTLIAAYPLGSGIEDLQDNYDGYSEQNMTFAGDGDLSGLHVADFNSSYYGIDNDLYNGFDTEYSFSMWLKPETIGGGQKVLMMNEQHGSYYGTFGVYLTDDGQLYLFVRDANDNVPYDIAYTGVSLVVDEWSHVVATWNGSKIKWYVDGALSSTTAASRVPWNSPATLWIGANKTKANKQYFDGKMSDLRFWYSELSSAEVEELYNNGANPQGENNNMLKFKLGGLALDSFPLEVTLEVYDADGLIFQAKPDGWDQPVVDGVHPLAGTEPEWTTDVPMGSEVAFPEQYTVRLVDTWGDASVVEDSEIQQLEAINGDGIIFANIPITGDVLSNLIGTDGGPEGAGSDAVQFEAVVLADLSDWESISVLGLTLPPKRQRTRVKAQYQVNNESDAADASHHFVQTDGAAKMADEYSPTGFQSVSTAGWLSYNLSNVIGTDPDEMTPAIVWADGLSYIDETNMIGAAQQLDEALNSHVELLASYEGAAQVAVSASVGEHGNFSIASDDTLQDVIDAFVTNIDIFKAGEDVAGSIKQITDDAVAAMLTGATGSQLIDSMNAISGAFHEILNEEGDSIAGFTGNLVGILNEIKFDIQGAEVVEGDFKALEYGTLKKISDSLGVRTLLEVSDDAKETFMKAINEVNDHADLAALSLKADHDFASGPYGATLGNYVADGATVDAALVNLDAALKASMDAMGLTAGGAFDDLGEQKFIVNSDTVEGAFIKIDNVAKNLEDSIDPNFNFDAASGPWQYGERPDSVYISTGADIAQALHTLELAISYSMTNMGLSQDGVLGLASGSYIENTDSVKEALEVLDNSLLTSMTNMGLDTEGKLDDLAETRFLSVVVEVDGVEVTQGFTSIEDSLIELDSELDYVRTATIDLLEGDQAMVRKGDHVEEWAVATEGQTEFTLSGEKIHLSSLMVFRNGLLLRKGDAYDYEVDQAGDVMIVLQGDYVADLEDEFCFKFIKKASAAYAV